MALNHLVNGTPVEVKHIDYGTSGGYETSGTPTITNGVLTGISSSNLCYTSNSLPQTDFKTIEFFFKIRRIPASTYLPICGFNVSSSSFRFAANSTAGFSVIGGTTYGTIANIPVSEFSYTDNIINWTYVKVLVTKNENDYTYQISVSADKQNWVSASGTAEANICYGKVYFLKNSSGAGGSVPEMDFNETYIKVDGKLWFFRPCTNYLVKDDKLVFADSGLYLSGPNTYTVVGSPTIVDNVASGFSSGNYLRIQNPIDFPSQNSFEYVVKFKIGISDSGINGGILSFPYKCISTGTTGSLGIYKWSNSLTIYGGFLSDNSFVSERIPFTAGAIRYVRWKKENNVLYTHYSTDGQNWTQLTTDDGANNTSFNTTSSIDLGSFAGWDGYEIYLNETYIKVNGSLWFYGKNYASQNIAPVPAGYPLGNTTTPSIGWVDMRTQQFTAAPAGATLGKDEVSEGI